MQRNKYLKLLRFSGYMNTRAYFLYFLSAALAYFSYVCAEEMTTPAKDSMIVSNALNQLHLSDEGYSVFDLMKKKNGNLAAITQLKLAQRYGDITYDKFNPFSMVRLYGFTAFNMVIRSRQELDAFSIGSYLFPLVIIPDINGKDISAHAETIIAANITRIGLFFNPVNTDSNERLYGILEFDFTGVSQATSYCAKIRHTFGEYIWNSGSVLFGQYFHPLFLPECFPRTVSSSMGASFEPQALVPQFRFTQMLRDIELIVAIASEGYIKSWVRIFSLSEFIQNAIVPNIHFQFKWRSGLSFFGGAIDYKRLTPRLVSSANYKVNEYIDSLIGEVFIHNVFRWGEVNLKAVYAENGADQLLISGFGIKSVDPTTNYQTYANTRAMSAWLDAFCVFCCDTMSLGLFVGGVKNLGSKHALYIAAGSTQPTVFAIDNLAQTVDYTVRMSPRFLYAYGAFRFGFELTWDKIAFGNLDKNARVIDTQSVNSFSYEASFNYVF